MIAPPHSRLSDMAPNGWLFMWARGSRAVAISSDVLFKPRWNEKVHKHGITYEVYACYEGELEITVEDEPLRISRGELLLVEPGEMHVITKVVSYADTLVAYTGSTLQFPCLLGDKYFARNDEQSN